MAWLHAVDTSAWQDNSKMITVVFIWICYVANWILSVWGGWTGKRAAIFSIINFVLLFGLYFLVNLFFTHFHGSV